MDVILEVFDTFAFDPIYASLLPVTAKTGFPGSPRNGTYSGFPQQAAGSIHNGWEYQPASSHLNLTPGDSAYLSQWPRDNVWRQAISLYLITAIFGCVTYFVFATLSYVFVFDKAAFNHPRYLKNQMAQEIKQSCTSMPIMAILTVVPFLAEVRGWSKMYDSTADGPGRWYDILQFPLFFLFTDSCIYWIHRGLHHPLVYKRLHKPHHKWIVPTPFASHAFHPLDGFAQSIPYHVFPFVFPLQKFAYVALFVFVNIWTVMIHDGEYAMQSQIINGAACHTLHHLYFNFNYGQFTTLWDRIGGSYRKPNVELFLREEKMSKKEWERQTKEMQEIVDEVEGDANDRVYLNDAAAKKAQ